MPKYDLIEAEIKWCEAHRNPEQKVFQDGFISGLQHALFLMKSRPTRREADVAKRAEMSEDDIWNEEWHALYDDLNESRRRGEIER